MNTKQHTQGPFRVRDINGTLYITTVADYILPENPEVPRINKICRMESPLNASGYDTSEAEVNAHFLVRAANNHEALVEALEATLNRLKRLDRALLAERNYEFETDLHEVMQGNAALAAARKEKA